MNTKRTYVVFLLMLCERSTDGYEEVVPAIFDLDILLQSASEHSYQSPRSTAIFEYIHDLRVVRPRRSGHPSPY